MLIKPVELWPATNTMDSLRNDDQTFDLDVVSLPWGKILGCRAAAAVTVAGPFWSLEIWTTKSDSLLLHWSNRVNLQVQITRLSSIETDYVSTTSVYVLPFQIGVDATEGTEGLAPKPSHWSTLWLQIENHWHEPRANIDFHASFDEKWWRYNQKASLEMTFYFRNMQCFEKQDNKLSVFSTWSFFRQMLRLVVWIEWSRSFHLPSQPLQCPASVPHIGSSRSNSATLGRRFSFRYRWIYLLEKSIETLLCWNQEAIGILQQRWKFLNFCRQGLAYRPLPALGRWNSFRFACAAAGNGKNRWIPLVQDKQIQGLISYSQNDTLTARGLQSRYYLK